MSRTITQATEHRLLRLVLALALALAALVAFPTTQASAVEAVVGGPSVTQTYVGTDCDGAPDVVDGEISYYFLFANGVEVCGSHVLGSGDGAPGNAVRVEGVVADSENAYLDIHTSCSVDFVSGWGSDGFAPQPTNGDDWEIVTYWLARSTSKDPGFWACEFTAPTTTTTTTSTTTTTTSTTTTTTSTTTTTVAPTVPTTVAVTTPTTVPTDILPLVIEETLPQTGADTDAVAMVAGFMLLLGGALVAGSHFRRGESFTVDRLN